MGPLFLPQQLLPTSRLEAIPSSLEAIPSRIPPPFLALLPPAFRSSPLRLAWLLCCSERPPSVSSSWVDSARPCRSDRSCCLSPASSTKTMMTKETKTWMFNSSSGNQTGPVGVASLLRKSLLDRPGILPSMGTPPEALTPMTFRPCQPGHEPRA